MYIALTGVNEKGLEVEARTQLALRLMSWCSGSEVEPVLRFDPEVDWSQVPVEPFFFEIDNERHHVSFFDLYMLADFKIWRGKYTLLHDSSVQDKAASIVNALPAGTHPKLLKLKRRLRKVAAGVISEL